MPRPKVYRNRKPEPQAEVEASEELTYDELYEMAQERGIRGRSNMSKKELIEALS